MKTKFKVLFDKSQNQYIYNVTIRPSKKGRVLEIKYSDDVVPQMLTRKALMNRIEQLTRMLLIETKKIDPRGIHTNSFIREAKEFLSKLPHIEEREAQVVVTGCSNETFTNDAKKYLLQSDLTFYVSHAASRKGCELSEDLLKHIVKNIDNPPYKTAFTKYEFRHSGIKRNKIESEVVSMLGIAAFVDKTMQSITFSTEDDSNMFFLTNSETVDGKTLDWNTLLIKEEIQEIRERYNF